ncbi:MerR family transcriptional regulator [Microbacterium sp.]|uniref:MerR family transcriptional regulator n=1 Tax=Microbacterium sp. TaxID=51671 RepID=UPI002FE1B4B9
MTTALIGRAAGYSTQQVRDLERLGVIPEAVRGANGYRRYTGRHVIALRAYRALAAAVGPVSARHIMPELIAAPLDIAAERIDDLHADIARARARVREALLGLDAVLADTTVVFDDRDVMSIDVMSIGELADALGVRTSALRHWELVGLVAPGRATGASARRYGVRAVTEARVVAALRGGGYPIPTIARVLDQLRSEGGAGEARSLLAERLNDLSRRSVALLEASGALHALLSDPG